MTVDNTCTTHCTKPTDILRHFIYWFLMFSDSDFLVNSVEDHFTCHTFPRARVCLVQACLGQLAPRGESWTTGFFISCGYRIAAHIDAEWLCFHPQLGQFPDSYTIGKLTVYSLMPCPILNKEQNSCTVPNEWNANFTYLSIHKMAAQALPNVM